jgi:hypothetical protein
VVGDPDEEEAGGCWWLGIGGWILGVGYWLLAISYWTLVKVALHVRSIFRVM